MAFEKEKRKYPRYTVPVLVEVPSLSDFPLVPEDVSGGGFRIVVSRMPDPDRVVDCTLQIDQHTFSPCKGRVVWCARNPTDPPTWTVGLSVQMHEESQKELDALLKTSVAELDVGPEMA